MSEEMQAIITQKAENGRFLFEVPAASVPPSLRSGQMIADTIKRLIEEAQKARLVKRREQFLKHAEKAEKMGNDFRAGRAFALTMYCDGLLRPDVLDAYAYVRSAMPVY